MRVEWSPDPEKMLNGQSPLPIGVPCAGWPACGTRLLRREAGLSDVGSIPGSLGIQPGEGLAASGRRKARAAYMLMAQRGEASCHVMRQMKRVSRQKTRSAKSQSSTASCEGQIHEALVRFSSLMDGGNLEPAFVLEGSQCSVELQQWLLGDKTEKPSPDEEHEARFHVATMRS
ncbi:uncharacterized protein [Vicugna pacos]|uniref:Uncharacterized protein isoform X5 n=2 Tax=Vicugna pacos TaxID=30538 RepID=A0ABM5DSJ3_VICPA